MWLIKGKGAAMFKEKLNIISSPITYILVDKTKFVSFLGEKCKVPVEVFPSAMKYVSEELKKLDEHKLKYKNKIENFYEKFCSIEKGEASKIVGDYIFEQSK